MSLSWKKLNCALQWRQQHGKVVFLIIGNVYVMIMSSVFLYIIIFIDINTPLCVYVCVDGDASIKNGRHLWGGESVSGFARSLSFSRARWVPTNIKQEKHTHTSSESTHRCMSVYLWMKVILWLCTLWSPLTPLNIISDLEDILANNRSYDRLLAVWKGWRDATGPAIKPLYQQFVALSNEGVRELGKTSTPVKKVELYVFLSTPDIMWACD